MINQIVDQMFPNSIIKNFLRSDTVLSCEPFGNGHINDTFHLVSDSGEFILQRVNKHVFLTGPLINNYKIVNDSLSSYQKGKAVKLTPIFHKTLDGQYHHIDNEGAAWRLVEFVKNAIAYEISPNLECSFEAARAMGRFQLFLNTIEPDLIEDTIPNFHNLPERFLAFQESCQGTSRKMIESAEREIQQANQFAHLADEYLARIKLLPQRVTHNDTKLNNIIFSGKGGLVIDLDTIMKSYVMLDFGDMVRTFTSSAAEDERNLNLVVFRPDHFEAIVNGYLDPLNNKLSTAEIESLLPGAFYIIYEQALRFLTDYLNGNKYYKATYPEHNLARTKTQLKLLSGLKNNENRLSDTIGSYL